MARRDIVVDLETLGTRPGCMVPAAALVEVNIATGEFLRSELVELDLNDQRRYGLEIDPDTMTWWMGQSNDARKLFKRLGEGQGMPLHQGLLALSNFILGDTAQDPDAPVPHPDVFLWGNSDRFDNGILGALYYRAGMKEPWPFWQDRDLRTLREAATRAGYSRPRTDPTTAHDAMADAVAQAQDVLNYTQWLATNATATIQVIEDHD